jgi:CRP-like cAMP-binding protein
LTPQVVRGFSSQLHKTLQLQVAPLVEIDHYCLGMRRDSMVKKPKSVFDPRVFLATADGGRTISNYPKDDVIFLQGDRADAVFYVQEG